MFRLVSREEHMRYWLPFFIILILGGTDLFAKSKSISNFRLSDVQGNPQELYAQKQSKLVVLFYGGNGCPIVRKSIQELKTLRDQFASQGAVFWILNANPQDDLASIREEAQEFQIDFPILKDESQSVTRALGVRRTAEVLVVRTSDWSIVYRGAISDRLGYGSQKVKDVQPYLENALRHFFAGKAIRPSHTEVRGCAITLEDNLKKEPSVPAVITESPAKGKKEK